MMCPSIGGRGQKKVRRRWGSLRRLAGSAVLPCLAALALIVLSAGCSGAPAYPPLVMHGKYIASAETVFVRSGDVYVGGTQFDPSQGDPFAFPLAVLWRNGEVCRRIPESGHMLNAGKVFLANDGSVYATGTVQRPNSPMSPHRSFFDPVAAFWKDGEIHYLDIPNDDYVYPGTGPYLPNESFAVDMAVADNGDVYITGYVTATASGISHVILWKNGEPSYLADGSSKMSPGSIFIFGEDVYIAGAGQNPDLWRPDADNKRCAALWKNGEIQYLTDGDGESVAASVFVQGDDVYVAGTDSIIKGQRSRAVLWKNGVKQNLTDAPERDMNYAYSVFVSGDDVYVTGRHAHLYVYDPNQGKLEKGFSLALLWKNGEKSVLPIDGIDGLPGSVFVQGDDVYVAGDVFPDPVLWKNGVAHKLPFAKE